MFEYLDCCFQSGIIMTTATMSILVVFVEAHSFAFLLGAYSEVELLGKYGYEHVQL